MLASALSAGRRRRAGLRVDAHRDRRGVGPDGRGTARRRSRRSTARRRRAGWRPSPAPAAAAARATRRRAAGRRGRRRPPRGRCRSSAAAPRTMSTTHESVNVTCPIACAVVPSPMNPKAVVKSRNMPTAKTSSGVTSGSSSSLLAAPAPRPGPAAHAERERRAQRHGSSIDDRRQLEAVHERRAQRRVVEHAEVRVAPEPAQRPALQRRARAARVEGEADRQQHRQRATTGCRATVVIAQEARAAPRVAQRRGRGEAAGPRREPDGGRAHARTASRWSARSTRTYQTMKSSRNADSTSVSAAPSALSGPPCT